MTPHSNDSDVSKGAVEQDAPRQETNTSLQGQLGHRTEDPLVKDNDTDFPEPGNNEEHSGEPQGREVNPEDVAQDDPGHRQKRNQDTKDDPLAA